MKTLLHWIQHRPITATIQVVEPQKILNDKVVLITGGTSGIGEAIARVFFKAGATVIITSRSEKKALETAKKIDSVGNSVYGIGLDMDKIALFSVTLNQVLDKIPQHRIDILVNNAGINGGDIRNTSIEAFDRVINTNLKGVFFLSKIIADHMIKNNIKGNILNVASSSSVRPAISAYSLTKWGIRGLTEGLAKMLIPFDIVVNGIAPGPTATPLLNKLDYSDISHNRLPNRRYALPEEIASMALFLAGPQGRTIIGDIVYMTGGAGIIENNDIDYTYSPI